MEPSNKTTVPIRSYSIGQVAALYGHTTRTINRWVSKHPEEIGERIGHYFTPKQVKLIFQKFGFPPKKD